MKNKDEWLEISDMKKFADYIRTLVFVNFTEDESDNNMLNCFKKLSSAEKEELENLLDINECMLIIKNKAKKLVGKKTKKIKYIMNTKLLNSIIEDINQRMVSNIIQTLVAKGVLESAFDEEKNDFVFWTKED